MVLFWVILSFCISIPNGSETEHPVFKPESHTVDYGRVDSASNTKRELHFTNAGQAPLLITTIKSSCGCMYAIWPREPIPAGGKNKITVVYDTRRMGPFNKTLTVVTNEPQANGNNFHIIRVIGRVGSAK